MKPATQPIMDEAMQAFVAAKVILDKLYVDKSENIELLKNLGANAFWLGQLAYDQNDLDSAQPLFELYRDFSKRMNELEPDNVDAWIELYSAQKTLGSLYLQQQNHNAAKRAFKSTLEIIDQTLIQSPDVNILRSDKADTLSWLALTEQHLGNLSTVIGLHKQGQQELEVALVSSPNDANLLESLAYSFWHQAILFDYRAQYLESYDKTSRAIDILNVALQQDPKNEIWQEQLLSTKIFQLQVASKTPNNAPLYTQDTQVELDLLEENIKRRMKGKPYMLVNLIKYYQAIDNWERSAKAITQSKTLLNEYGNQNKSYLISIVSAKFYLLIAKQHIQNKELDEQLQACEQAITLLQPLVSHSHNVDYLLPYVQAHDCLGQLTKVHNLAIELEKMQIHNYRF
jgi:tetratricopeptide (TPR) repeat protein